MDDLTFAKYSHAATVRLLSDALGHQDDIGTFLWTLEKQVPSSRKITIFGDLPGAVFFGDIDQHDFDDATRLQQISSDYAETLRQIRTSGGSRAQRRVAREDAEFFLRVDLQEAGFDPSEIDRCVANPERITSGAYVSANALEHFPGDLKRLAA
jgi:hypothetical protein